MNTKSILLVIFALVAGQSFCQLTTELSENNAAAKISNNGTFFHEPATNIGGYELPKDSEKKGMYFMGLMALGKDLNSQLKGAICNYNQSDWFPGPISSNYQDPDYISNYATSLWEIDEQLINQHITHWNDVGYIPPQIINDWPANGNTTNGESPLLAPFEDLDNDGIYEPSNGEYPLIRGNRAVYVILNDQQALHPSGISAGGLEVHVLFYQFNSLDTVINNTTFIHTTWFNRSTSDLNDFYVSTFTDFDIGLPYDDYFGTIPNSNLAVGYNGDLNDESQAGITGYGENPPAFAIYPLNSQLLSHVGLDAPNQSGSAFYNQMQGLTATGAAYLDNNNAPTTYQYNQLETTGWNQFTDGISPNDYRTIITMQSEQSFVAGTSFCLDFCVVFAENDQIGELFGAINNLIGNSEMIQDFYDVQNNLCAPVLELIENENSDIQLFPNPVESEINLSLPIACNYVIYDQLGTLVQKGKIVNGKIDADKLTKGYYFLTIEPNGTIVNLSFIK